MAKITFTVQPLGDRAFSLVWSVPTPPATLAAKALAIERLAFPWLQEVVPAYQSITIHLNPYTLTPEDAAEELLSKWNQINEEQLISRARQVELPVVYGGEHGPDLTQSAMRSGITEQQFINRHAETAYVVAMIGFAPGFPYLSGLNETLAQPRHATPRLKVPEGAVGIAGKQTGIYPVTSPGGWQIIGRTTSRLFRPEEKEPFLLAAGDVVKFVPVEEHAEAVALTPAKHESRDRSQAVLTVLKPGVLTTIQDLGRIGWQAYGVSVGGAMDEVALRTANLLVGNNEDVAGIEMSLIGGSYFIEQDILISLCGADLGATADGERIPLNRPVWLSQGMTLYSGRALSGCRAYMAIAGGIDVPKVLGSRSADTRARIGGGLGRALAAGDSLFCLLPSGQTSLLQATLRTKARKDKSRWSTVSWYTTDWSSGIGNLPMQTQSARVITLRLLLGAEWEQFDMDSQHCLFEEPYRLEVSSDRMGLRLSGTPLMRNNQDELLSHGVTPGTIQVPPNGQPIILAAGCQPTGGYPKIAHVISCDLPLLAQAVPGDWLIFELTDRMSAQRALMEREKALGLLRTGLLVYSRI